MMDVSADTDGWTTFPKIMRCKWGAIWIKIGDVTMPYEHDVILCPDNTVKQWDWKVTGTSHHPGIQVADFSPYIGSGDRKIAALVLSLGMNNVLEVPAATLQYMR